VSGFCIESADGCGDSISLIFISDMYWFNRLKIHTAQFHTYLQTWSKSHLLSLNLASCIACHWRGDFAFCNAKAKRFLNFRHGWEIKSRSGSNDCRTKVKTNNKLNANYNGSFRKMVWGHAYKGYHSRIHCGGIVGISSKIWSRYPTKVVSLLLHWFSSFAQQERSIPQQIILKRMAIDLKDDCQKEVDPVFKYTAFHNLVAEQYHHLPP